MVVDKVLPRKAKNSMIIEEKLKRMIEMISNIYNELNVKYDIYHQCGNMYNFSGKDRNKVFMFLDFELIYYNPKNKYPYCVGMYSPTIDITNGKMFNEHIYKFKTEQEFEKGLFDFITEVYIYEINKNKGE